MAEFTTTIEVRFADMDAYGHVNSAHYFTYLEAARLKVFHSLFHELSALEMLLVVGRAECDYLIPILPTVATVGVTLQIATLGKTSFNLEYRIHDLQGTTYATAKTLMVCFDSRTQRPVSVPEQIRKMA